MLHLLPALKDPFKQQGNRQQRECVADYDNAGCLRSGNDEREHPDHGERDERQQNAQQDDGPGIAGSLGPVPGHFPGSHLQQPEVADDDSVGERGQGETDHAEVVNAQPAGKPVTAKNPSRRLTTSLASTSPRFRTERLMRGAGFRSGFAGRPETAAPNCAASPRPASAPDQPGPLRAPALA